MSPISRRSLVSCAALMPFLPGRLQAQGYGQPPQPAPDPSGGDRVVIDGMAFAPATLAVPAGTTVVFINQDGVMHTVTADNGNFDTGNIPPRGSVRITFPSAGAYPYHCAIHPSMRGAVTAS